MLKKFVSIIAAVAMMLNVSVFAADTVQEETAPVMDESFVRVLSVLDFLDILDQENFDPEGSPTRAEFVKASVREYGLGAVAQTAEPSGFTDVSDEYDGYISVAKSMGIVNGYTETEFGPDDAATYFQGLKIMVSMIGYKSVIENPEGYPDEYFNVAAKNGLLTGVSAKAFDEPMTNRDMALMLYNALETKMLEPLSYGEDREYTVTDNTILGSVLNVTKASGVVTANPVTSIDSPDQAAPEGCVTILSDGKSASYRVENTDIADMLGVEVVYYFYQDSQSTEPILLGYYIADGSKMMEIEADQIEQINEDSLVYYRESAGNSSKLSFRKGIRIIFNGKAVTAEEYNMNLLDINQGTLRFVSGSGSQYDTVLIFSYQNTLISSVNEAEQEIYFSDNIHGLSKMVLYDLDSLELTKNGEEAELTDLVKNDVAAVAWSLDQKAARILVSDQMVSGKVTQMNDVDDKTMLSIDDVSYQLAYDAPEKIKLGDEGTFLLDPFGHIFCPSDSTAAGGLLYAYVMDKTALTSLDTTYMVKLLDQSGEILTLNLQSKVRVNDESISDEAAYAAVKEDTLIQYQRNSDDLVQKIYTATDYTNNTEYRGYDEEVFSKDNPSNSMYFKNTAIPSFGGLYLVPQSVPVFNIPDEKEDEDYYMVTDTSIFTSDVFYNVELFDADKRRQVGAVVNRGVDLNASSEATLPWNSAALVVQSMETIYHEERGMLNVITGYQNGELVTIIPTISNNTRFPELGDVVMEEPDKENSTLFSDLRVGDVIQYKLNAKSEVDAFRVLYRAGDDLGIRIWNGANYAVNLLTAVSMVAYADEDTLCITIDDNKNNTPVSNRVFALPEDVNVYQFDGRKNEVRMDQLENLVSMDNSFSGADKIFIRAYRDAVADIVILKGVD
ncbi:S-layer homology domain-containing protein [Ructibacterium gallinarum]|uniref:S-layer homology domain-containing protein n=1 Tax=Ructibacterium gallinarum TaxID=2779355 RepID=A0A9D5R8T7_9FIRM|nr:S-layer homology domain-containing protein [Ructibacterium gallinarum]MBE5040345.1 S-layer homology domain-containing protein [Ructibacterium gallinarum]